jgi:peptide/nickel transport system substrate-binding protein
MRKVMWVALLAMLAVALVAVAGCGGESTTTTAANTATSAGTDSTAGQTVTTNPTATTTAAGEPVTGGVAKIALMSSPAKFGFPMDVIGPDQWFEGLFLESVVYPTDKADEYIPGLAESWELTADKTAYIFHLRKGVKFTDGTDFNAAAAKFCWDLNLAAGDAPAAAPDTTAASAGPAAAPAGPPAGAGTPPDFAFVKSVEVVDDYTVKVNLKYWNNQVLPFIARKSWAVFSPTAFKEMGKEKMDINPVGTGPFVLKSYTPNQEMVLEKNPTYWMKDDAGRQLPYLDGIQILIFKDPTSQLVAVQSGEVDGADHISMTGAQQLQSDSNFTLEHFGGPVNLLEVNTSDPNSVWSNVKMRQALEYAIDKEGISKSVGLGFTPAVYTIIHSISAVADPGTTPRKYDPEKAKQLMAEAGHTSVDLTISFNSNEVDPAMVTAIQANLAAVGINAKVNAMPAASFAPVGVKPPTGNDIILNGERGGAPNILQGASEMFSKGNIYFPGAVFPDQFYTLMEQAAQAASVADTYPICVEMEKVAYGDATLIPVVMADFISVSGPKLKNLKWNFANLPGPFFQTAWLTK